MHWLSHHNRSEFLACPQLIRFDYAKGEKGFEPTLLIKGSTLLLKYIALGAHMQLAFASCCGRLVCALKVRNDGDSGGILWSIVEREEELNAIRGLARGEPLVAFLFNELAVNVAWNDLYKSSAALEQLTRWTNKAILGTVDYSTAKCTIGPLLDHLHQCVASDDVWLVLDVVGRSNWKPIQNHFITVGASSRLIDFFASDEGNQQEQICVWLTDNLQPSGAHHSPRIPKGRGTRELTDLLLSHEFGTVLIESKTLSIFARKQLPDRAKLKRDISTCIEKAFNQLRGAIGALKSGVPVTNLSGEAILVEREKPAHAIVLIPDLDLVDERAAYGIEFIRDFMNATGGFPHLLDISELLRVVQAAEMIAARGKSTTLMMAFDYYLMQRAEKAVEAGTLCIEILVRFADKVPTAD